MSDGASTYTVVETLRFESRVLKPYADFVAASDLVVGEVYFVVHFVDDRMLVPELKPLVFVGKDVEPGDVNKLHFQDAASYLAGVRHDSPGSDKSRQSVELHTIASDSPFVLEFERALDVLMLCSLNRRR